MCLTESNMCSKMKRMLDVAVRRLDGSTAVDLTRRVAPALPIHPALSPLLPDGIRRGSTVSVSGSVSLLLALISAASAEGAWCALVGLPTHQRGGSRRSTASTSNGWPIVPPTGSELDHGSRRPARCGRHRGAASRPRGRCRGDVRRLAARARNRDAVLMPFQPGTAVNGETWPAADVRLSAQGGRWTGIGAGYGRLRQRRLTVTAEGRGSAARSRSSTLWLPAAGGGVGTYEPVAPVLDLTARAG